MRITKAGKASAEIVVSEELEAVNAFAKAKLTDGDVYIFSVLLCDNEVDRDFERFSEKTLRELSELFVGVTGICDHDWKSENQVARIYRTELVTDPERKNSLGAPYTYLKGMAYMLRNEANAELIAEIEGGIKRETSVGCAVAESLCSVCGEKTGTCAHRKGESYGGRLCHTVLEGAVDAYEWSFVAVPAQKRAGVIKHYEGGLRGFTETEDGMSLRKEYEELRKAADMGRRYMESLRKEVLRLCLVCDRSLYKALEKSVALMDEESILSLKAALDRKADELYPPAPQLPGRDEITAFDGNEYLI